MIIIPMITPTINPMPPRIMPLKIIKIIFFVFAFLLTTWLYAEPLTIKETDKGYEVYIGDELFAGYISDYEGAPIIYPVIGPTGKSMTRDFPMKKDYEPIQSDHPHQRSCWFSHGNVNGFDFWNAFARPLETRYKIVQTDKRRCGVQGIATRNDWIANGQVICSDIRIIRFSAAKNLRIIDFDIKVTAVQDSVVFGDTKEGTFGIRVPEVMAVDSKKGGRFVNAEGLVDGAAWGKRSPWVCYHGLIDGETAGITIMNHPSSFRFPTFWHVREYGLFAANPFGVNDFENKNDKQAGNHVLAKGESFTLRYRVIFHKGDATEANIADEYQKYILIKSFRFADMANDEK